MNKTGELIFIHIWIILWVIICAKFIWGDYAEKSYNARMKLSKWLMPGKLADKDYYIKWTKNIFYFSLPFGILIYLLTMYSVFKK